MMEDNVRQVEQKILCVGLCCVDFVTLVNRFPVEDSDQRCIDMWKQRGGNASNNCTFLSWLGTHCEYLGTLAQSDYNSFLKKDFQECELISLKNVVIHENCVSPTSVIIINQENGSRTILHSNKQLPELTFEDFKKIKLQQYTWIHFEGRNIKEIMQMITYVRESHLPITVSVELEKNTKDLEALLAKADVTFVSKDFAQMLGHTNVKDAVKELVKLVAKESIIIIPWGEDGAAAMKSGNPDINYSPSYPPLEVKDTLGAGDAFVAATINCLNSGRSLRCAIDVGCQIAGAKCGAYNYRKVDLNKILYSP